MSCHTHETLIITANRDAILAILPELDELQLVHSGPMAMIERFACVAIAPSGSKYGWPEYSEHKEKLELVVTHLKALNQVADGVVYSFVRLTMGENMNGEDIAVIREHQVEVYTDN